MLEDKGSLNSVRSSKARGWVRLCGLKVGVVAPGDGARLFASSNVHGRVETCQLDAIPEGTPYKPRQIVIVYDEVRVYGVPVIAYHFAVLALLPFV